MSPRVSIITPSYNQGRFIERTIESVLSQNMPDMEYLIFDGASSDNTLDILKKYDDRLHWVSEKDGGQTQAVNKGISQATGDIIGWLNSDDIYYPNAVSTICDVFTKNPDFDVVYGNAYHVDGNNKIIEKYYTENWNLDRLKEVCYICQPAVFFRRSVIEKYGLLDESLHYCMDYEYWLRIAVCGAKFFYLPNILAGSRLYAETKTMSNRVAVHKEINDMLKKTLSSVPDRWLSNYAHVKIEKKGISRKHRSYFIAILVWMMLCAALKWNRKINKSLLVMCLSWLKK